MRAAFNLSFQKSFATLELVKHKNSAWQGGLGVPLKDLFLTQVLRCSISNTPGACDARAKRTVAINFADVSDLVADRRDLADARLQPLFSARRTAQTVTSILPNVRREE